jgi:uncharacterized protein (DUF58 family)
MKLFNKNNRIYIFPTKMGGYLIGLLFLMFLLSVGYGNNLLLIFTLFLFGFNLLWLIQTNFHLKKLNLSHIEFPDGHEGEEALVRIKWRNLPEGLAEWNLQVENDTDMQAIQSIENSNFQSIGLVRLSKRGRVQWSFLKVSTTRPYGLYRAWIYLKLDQVSFVYPKLKYHEGGLQLLNHSHEGESPNDKKGPNDIRNLAPYQGEEFRRISWKHYARSGEILIKEGEDHHSPLWIENLELQKHIKNKESYLSDVATNLVYCYRNQIQFVATSDK